jgi:hypothetical protein
MCGIPTRVSFCNNGNASGSPGMYVCEDYAKTQNVIHTIKRCLQHSEQVKQESKIQEIFAEFEPLGVDYKREIKPLCEYSRIA